MSSVNIFQTGKSGLFASRSQLATTGHNVANVNTEGYSRQRVEQVTAPPSQIGTTVFGTGTKIKTIHRVNDEFVTKQLSREAKLMGQYEEKDLAMTQAEAVFNEINNEGMNRLMSRYFNEFRKLGNEPESEALRSTVRETSEQLIGDFKRIARSMNDIQKNIDIRLESSVRQTNEYVARIADLNHQIKTYEIHGGEAADLRDSRDLAIKKLSNIADVEIASNERGELTISLRDAGPLVSGSLINKLYLNSSKADVASGLPEGSMRVYLENRSPPEVTSKLKNSRLGGLVEARDKILGEARKRLDELAYTFATKVNDVHRQGFNLNGSTGMNFFKQPKQLEGAAELLSLSDEVKADANNIATALEADSPGDNRLVQHIAKLQHSKIMSNGTSTFDDHYNATVADLATVSQKNKQFMEHQGHIVAQLEKLRESISGVSLDEETTNLVQFQHAFDASAKVIKVAYEMLDTVLRLRG